jgi:hypothetical protein
MHRKHRLYERTIAAVLGLALVTLAHAVGACTVPMPYDPKTIFRDFPRDEIVRRPEVIVEGVVEPYAPAPDEPDDSLGFTRIRIDRVWKGDLGSSAIVIFQTASMDCSQPPPFGQRIRFGADLIEKRILLGKGGDGMVMTPQRLALLETENDVIYFGRSRDGFLPFALPLQDGELDRMLADYQSAIQTMRSGAAKRNRPQRLDYAAFLTEHKELHRALKVYESVFRENPDDLDFELTLAVARSKVLPRNEFEATLADVAQRSPQSDEWRNKIARTRLAATGKFTDGWKDWSALQPAGACNGARQDFSGASFDAADLRGCSFQSAALRGASFRHTNLAATDLAWADLAGAKYDCATRFPPDFDPAKAGMVNVEGACPTPNP